MRHPKHALSQDTASRPFKSSFCPSGTKKVSLALHGAFTWGVLDMLLEDGRFEIERVSGTSAGGMNAVALIQGLMKNGKQGGTNCTISGKS